MTDRQEKKNLILPLAIMAHNEEGSIERAVRSALSQKIPRGYFVKVIVVANGCTDKTEEIVSELERQNPEKVILVSVKEKGKTKAINRGIKYFGELAIGLRSIPYIIFLDADCEFVGNDALVKFLQSFKDNPELSAIGADCLPDSFFNGRNDFVAEIYRAIYELGRSIRINSISGMCYGIRFDVLKKIEFPDFQFAEDMFLSARLDGWFFKDRNIQIVFKVPSNFSGEVRRRTRQEISTQRYHEYYSTLKNKRGKVKIFEGSLGDGYRWRGAMVGDIINNWFRLEGVKAKILVLTFFLIRGLAKIGATRKLITMKKNREVDYWKVLR